MYTQCADKKGSLFCDDRTASLDFVNCSAPLVPNGSALRRWEVKKMVPPCRWEALTAHTAHSVRACLLIQDSSSDTGLSLLTDSLGNVTQC